MANEQLLVGGHKGSESISLLVGLVFKAELSLGIQRFREGSIKQRSRTEKTPV